MTIALGCIADDYTGASDLANALTTNGLRCVQTIGIPEPGFTMPEVDAVVVALKTRSVPAEDAVSQSLAAGRWLKAQGARHILFKVCSTFDSTDAGNIGPVTEALRQAAGGGIVIVNPGYPAAGRRVFQGHLFVHDQPLHESPLKDHPLNPMRDANLVRVLARQGKGPVGLVPLQTVERGAGAVRSALAALAAYGMTAAIVDAVADRHFDILAEVALDDRVSTGASGLGIGLARTIRQHAPERAETAPVWPPVPPGKGHAAIIAGSCSKATLEQIAEAGPHMPVLQVKGEALLGDDGVQAVLGWARDRLPEGPVLIASSAPPDVVRSLQARHGSEALGRRIEEALSTLAEGLVAAGVGRLVVAGGETSGAIVNRLRLGAFHIGAEIAPGVPALGVIGRHHAGLRVVLKSGNFGGPDFFVRALEALR